MIGYAGLAVFIGAGLGALLRWALGARLNPILPHLPLGTLAANLTGGYLVGLFIALLQQHPQIDPAWRLLLVTGFLGALTTFSSFSMEVVDMLMLERWVQALLTATVLIMAVGIFIPMGPLAGHFKLQALPLAYFPWLVGILAGYVLLTTVMKRWYVRRYGWQ